MVQASQHRHIAVCRGERLAGLLQPKQGHPVPGGEVFLRTQGIENAVQELLPERPILKDRHLVDIEWQNRTAAAGDVLHPRHGLSIVGDLQAIVDSSRRSRKSLAGFSIFVCKEGHYLRPAFV